MDLGIKPSGSYDGSQWGTTFDPVFVVMGSKILNADGEYFENVGSPSIHSSYINT